jgi:hypothetical protein
MLNIIWRVTKITVIIEEIKHIQLVEQYLLDLPHCLCAPSGLHQLVWTCFFVRPCWSIIRLDTFSTRLNFFWWICCCNRHAEHDIMSLRMTYHNRENKTYSSSLNNATWFAALLGAPSGLHQLICTCCFVRHWWDIIRLNNFPARLNFSDGFVVAIGMLIMISRVWEWLSWLRKQKHIPYVEVHC